MRNIVRWAAVAALLPVLSLASAAHADSGPVVELQHLLNNSGYDTGSSDGIWSKQTGAALDAFEEHYQISVKPAGDAPTDAEIASILAASKTAVDADYTAYPTPKLDTSTYFAGVSNQWYYNIHTWSTVALSSVDGKPVRDPVQRFFQPLDADADKFAKAGIRVVREQLGVESALFYNSCDYKNDTWSEDCYYKAFRDAKADRWRDQTAELDHIADNVVVAGYVAAVKFWTDRGFQVIVVPSDFFLPGNHSFSGPDVGPGDTLLQAALMTDPGLQEFLPKFVAALVGELRRANITNVAVQSINEPRYCPQGKPSPHGLEHWQAEEQSIFDAVRRVAPRISLIGSAICVAGVTYANSDPGYGHLEKLVPLHPSLDDVTYALHMYNPAALFEAAASENEAYKPGYVVHYPYQKLATSSAADRNGQSAIEAYNKIKPDPALIEQRFSNIAAFAASQHIHIMITEAAVAKSTFGLPREDRVALIGDLLRDSREHDVPLIYGATFDAHGLADCPYNFRVPDHRFDPALLDRFAIANGVVGAIADPAIPPLEATCGAPVKFQAKVQINNDIGNQIDTLLVLSLPGKLGESAFNIEANYLTSTRSVVNLQLIFHGNELSKGVPKGLEQCKNLPATVLWDQAPYLDLHFKLVDKVLTPMDGDCVIKSLPAPLAARVKQVVDNFAQIATDMTTSGDIDTAGPALKAWLAEVAAGNVKIAQFGD